LTRAGRSEESKPLPAALSRLGSRLAAMTITAALAFFAPLASSPVASAALPQHEFNIWNLTGGDLKIEGFFSHPLRDSRFPSGNLDKPGTLVHLGTALKVTLNAGEGTVLSLSGKWQNDGPDHNQPQGWRILMRYYDCTRAGDTLNRYCGEIKCQVAETPKTADCGNYIGDNVAIVADSQRTKIDVPATNVQKAAQILTDICANDYAEALKITCDYSGMDRTAVFGPYAMPPGFHPIYAGKDGITWKEYKYTHTITSTQSFDLSLSVAKKFFKIVEIGVNAQYHSATEDTETIENSTGLQPNPGYYGWICTSIPKYHYVGTLKAYAGWTQWTLEGVQVDRPIPVKETHPMDATFFRTAVPPEPDPCPGFTDKSISAAPGTPNGNQAAVAPSSPQPKRTGG
jgi:hypothetical protein